MSRACLLLSVVFLSLISQLDSIHAQNSWPEKSESLEATRVVLEPHQKPEKETAGTVEYRGYELVWPLIETHERAILRVKGEDFDWSQEFIDGDQPFFSPIEEGVEAGRYRFRIVYVHNDAGKEKRELETAVADRRALLEKRLELLSKGDREGAKAALEQANQLRSERSEEATLRKLESRSNVGNKPKHISRHGSFKVSDDGTVEAFDPMQTPENYDRQKELGARRGLVEESQEGDL